MFGLTFIFMHVHHTDRVERQYFHWILCNDNEGYSDTTDRGLQSILAVGGQ